MKLTLSFLFFFLLVIVGSSCAHKEKQIPRDIASVHANGGMEGIWFLQGSSSTRGPYNGELELRKSNDGTFDVVRVVTYINYFFDGLKVQEVWTGKAVATENLLTISYEIRQGDFIVKLGELKRSTSEMRSPVTVISRFLASPAGLTTQFTDKVVSDYKEWITTRRNLEARPLWQNERKTLSAKGEEIPPNVRAAINTFKKRIGYDKDPMVRSYQARREFKNEQPFIVFDPTDFEFYRKHKDVIRVVNKVTDDISITEAVVKRNAYAPSLEEKARGYDRRAEDFHLNEAGMIAPAMLGDDGKLLSYSSDDSSSLLTGMYVASQALRYVSVKDPQALRNVKMASRGLMTLAAVTGDRRELARALKLFDPKVSVPEGWYRGEGKYATFVWREGGDQETVKDIIHGLLWASTVVPTTESDFWTELRETSQNLLGLQVVSDSQENRTLALGLAALLTGDQVLRSQYGLAAAQSKLELNAPFYWQGTADWRSLQINLVSDITEIMLADLLNYPEIAHRLRRRLMDTWLTYSPSQNHLLTIAAYGFAYRYIKQADEKFEAALNEVSWGLREIPYPRPNLEVSIDHSLRPDWSLSPIPDLFWKPLKKPLPSASSFYQGLYSYPVFELRAFANEPVWSFPKFAFSEKSKKGAERPGVDYLFAYWMARYSGVKIQE